MSAPAAAGDRWRLGCWLLSALCLGLGAAAAAPWVWALWLAQAAAVARHLQRPAALDGRWPLVASACLGGAAALEAGGAGWLLLGLVAGLMGFERSAFLQSAAGGEGRACSARLSRAHLIEALAVGLLALAAGGAGLLWRAQPGFWPVLLVALAALLTLSTLFRAHFSPSDS